MSPKFSIARFFTALAGLLLALFFWELVLRAQRPQILNSPVFDHDPMVGNCYLPNLSAYQEYYGVASRLHTNAERLRQADDIPVEKAAGEKRVLVLGSSFTAGIGVGDEDTFVQLLQAAARRKYPSRKTVFMNAAVPGVGTVHAVTYLHYRGEALNPDFVLLVIGPNDVDANLGTGGWKPFVIPSSGPIQWTGEPAPKFPGTEMRVLLRKIPFYDFVLISLASFGMGTHAGARDHRGARRSQKTGRGGTKAPTRTRRDLAPSQCGESHPGRFYPHRRFPSGLEAGM